MTNPKDKAPSSASPDSSISTEETDAFQAFKKDPRIPTSIEKQNEIPKPTNFIPDPELIKNLDDEEDFLNRLRLFKRNQHKSIQDNYESKPLENRLRIQREISLVAENILVANIEFTKHHLNKRYGSPTYLSSYKQTCLSDFGILAMGKLATRELSYYSDLDLIFLFSHRGETNGEKAVTNQEYYTRFCQRFIHNLSLLTTLGRCYEIDTELRPSGNQGALVSSYDHFLDHQMNRAQNWERLALMRSRALSTSSEFEQLIQNQIRDLLFKKDLPNNFFQDMAAVRDRVVKEKSKETPTRFNLKCGMGSLMDVTFTVQGLQLKYSKILPDLRLQMPIPQALETFNHHDFLKPDEITLLRDFFVLCCTIQAKLQILKKRSLDFIDIDSEEYQQIAAMLNKTAPELSEELHAMRTKVREIFEKVYQ